MAAHIVHTPDELRMPDPTPNTDKYIGHRFGGRYEAIAPLGEGGLGTVYEGIQVSLQQKVAIKVLKPEVCKDPNVVRRFYNEARIYATLNHPNVVTIHDFGQTDLDNTLYLVMEYLSGIDLEHFIKERGPLSGVLLAQLTVQALQGLAAAHKLDIVHRDLKPANIMVLEADSSRPIIKLLDFGISKVDDVLDESSSIAKVDLIALKNINAAKETMVGQISGTPHYMSPEQCKAKVLDARSDIYSMGVVLYQVISGHLPFAAKTPIEMLRRHVFDPPRAFEEVAPDLRVPRLLEDIILRCLEKDPDDRFQTAGELLEAMEEYLQEQAGKNVLTLEEASELQGDQGDLPVSRRSFGNEEQDRPVEIVVDFLKRLGKAYKSFVTYPSDNPIFTTMAQAVKDQLDVYFTNKERLSLSVDRLAVFYAKKKVYEDTDLRTSYPFKMFSDGIRQIYISKGITLEEIARFLDCLCEVSSGQKVHSDLVTLMWEKKFKYIDTMLADDILEENLPNIKELQDSGLNVGGTTGYHGKPRGSIDGSKSAQQQHATHDALRGTLSESDRLQLQSLVGTELEADHIADFIHILTAVLGVTRKADDVKALIRIMSQVTQVLLGVGDYTHSIEVLKPVRATLSKTSNAAIRTMLEELMDHAGSEDNVRAALTNLTENTPEDESLATGTYLSIVNRSVVPTILDLLANDLNPTAQRIAMMALRQQCKEGPEFLYDALSHSSPQVIRVVLVILGNIGGAGALDEISKCVRHPITAVRKEAVRTLVKLRDPQFGIHVQPVMTDPELEVRIATMAGIATLGDQTAIRPLIALMEERTFLRWEPREQKHMFRVLGQLGGPQVTEIMSQKLLSNQGIFQNRTVLTSILVGTVALATWGLVYLFGAMIGIGVILLAGIGISFSGLSLTSLTPEIGNDMSEQAALCLEQIGDESAYNLLKRGIQSAPLRTRDLCRRIVDRRVGYQSE
jgi:serine/threonine protein kinase